MFDKFGEFDSAEELNRTAAAQLKDGDYDAMYTLAAENGIDRKDAEDYVNGDLDELTNPFMAAVGKLNVEAEYLTLEGAMEDYRGYIIQLCSEDTKFCEAVRRKGKRLSLCLAAILKLAFDTKIRIDDEIVKAAKLSPPLYVGMPGKKDIRNVIYNYYTGKEPEK